MSRRSTSTSPAEPKEEAPVILFDNGSIRPEAHLLLREVAEDLAIRSGRKVLPASLAHSEKVDPRLLNGRPATLFQPLIESLYAGGVRAIETLPFLLSPGGAIAAIHQRQCHQLQTAHPDLIIRILPGLFDPNRVGPSVLAHALVERFHQAREDLGWHHSDVVMVDHGSPRAFSAFVRNFIGGQVSALLQGPEIHRFAVASMERREGKAYDFNDPLLEDVLADWAPDTQGVIVLLFFLSPGRHAGEGGDIDSICREAASNSEIPLPYHLTDPIGNLPMIREALTAIVQGHP